MLVRQDEASRRSVVAILRLINETLEEKGTVNARNIDLCEPTKKDRLGDVDVSLIFCYCS